MRRSRGEWEELVRQYLRLQNEHGIRHAEFCETQGIGLRSFRGWLYRLTVPAEPVLQPARSRGGQGALVGPAAPSTGARGEVRPLNERDLAILKDIGHDRCESVELVASRHWTHTGHPEKNAYDRLRRLERAGLVQIVHRAKPIVYLTQKGARRVLAPMPRRFHPRHLDHHLQTLKAIDRLRSHLEAKGGQLVPFQLDGGRQAPYLLEIHVQSQGRAGQSPRGTVRGEAYDTAPDAVVRVQTPGGPVETIAVEYFTSAYSSEQIREKAELQRLYDGVAQFADTRGTAGRVEAGTGVGCEVIRG